MNENIQAADLADYDLFECAECSAILDIEESVKFNDYLICELCAEQFHAAGVFGD